MALEHKSGEGIWTEYVDTETNKSTIQEHKVKTVARYCKPADHEFTPVSATSREVICTKCGFVTTYILGLQTLIDKKITFNNPQG
jgi:hypothetical protein